MMVSYPDLACTSTTTTNAANAAKTVCGAASGATCQVITAAPDAPTCAAGVSTFYIADSGANYPGLEALYAAIVQGTVAGVPPTATTTIIGQPAPTPGTPEPFVPVAVSATAYWTARTNVQVTCVPQTTCATWTGYPAGSTITCVCSTTRQTGYMYVIVSPTTGFSSLTAFAQQAAASLASSFPTNVASCVTAYPAGSTSTSAGAATACNGIPSTNGQITVGNALATIKYPDVNCANDIATSGANTKTACGTTCTSVSGTCGTSRQNSVATIVIQGTFTQIYNLIALIRAGSVAGVPPTASIVVTAVSPSGQPQPYPLPPSGTIATNAYWTAKTTTQITCISQTVCAAAGVANGLPSTSTITCVCTSTRQAGFMNLIISPGGTSSLSARQGTPAQFAQAAANALGACVNVYLAGQTVPAAYACPAKQSKKGLLGLLGLLGLIPLLICLALLCCCLIRRKKRAADVHFATFDPQVANVAMPASVLPGGPMGGPFPGGPFPGGPVLP